MTTFEYLLYIFRDINFSNSLNIIFIIYILAINFIILPDIHKIEILKKENLSLQENIVFWTSKANGWKKNAIKSSDAFRECKEKLEKLTDEKNEYIEFISKDISNLTLEMKNFKNKIKENSLDRDKLGDEFVNLIHLVYEKDFKLDLCLDKIIEIANFLNIELEIKRNRVQPERESKNFAKTKISTLNLK
jgi:hypothetical protein